VARPRKITDEHIETIERLAGRGATIEDIAFYLGVDQSTFHRSRARSDAVSQAHKRGVARATIAMSDTLYDKAMGGDLGAIVWWEKTRAGRSEKSHVSGVVSGSYGVLFIPQPDPPESPEEWSARVQNHSSPHPGYQFDDIVSSEEDAANATAEG